MRVTRVPVPREVIPTLAVQVDPMRRIRQDGDQGRLGGMKVLSGHFEVSRRAADLLGYGPLTKRDYLSVPVEELRSLPPELQEELRLPKELTGRASRRRGGDSRHLRLLVEAPFQTVCDRGGDGGGQQRRDGVADLLRDARHRLMLREDEVVGKLMQRAASLTVIGRCADGCR